MNFWFCETCGKRLTEKDIEEGAARNKKLKGVFCQQCSVGVMTMEMDAISSDQLAKFKVPLPPPAAPHPDEARPDEARRSPRRISSTVHANADSHGRHSGKVLPGASNG